MKHLNLTLVALLLSIMCFAQAPAPIGGSPVACMGGIDPLTDDSTGGTWSSTTLSVATINSISGIVSPVNPGTTTISYATTGGTVYMVVTVNTSPASISGTPSVCVTGADTLTDATTGGTWASSDFYVATIDSVLGAIFAETPGRATISYIVNGCAANVTLTVNSLPYGAYSTGGGGIACSGTAGVPITLDGSSSGVNYQLFNNAVPVGTPVAGTGFPLTFGSYTTDGDYTVWGTDIATGCSDQMGGDATVADSASPSPYTVTITGTGAYCVGSAAPVISLSSSEAGVSYQLYNIAGSAIGAAVGGTGSMIGFGTVSTTGTYYVAAIDPASGCAANMSDSVSVTANPLPTAFTMGASTSYCRGTAGVSVTLSGSTTGIEYQLYDHHIAIGAPMSGTGSGLNFGFDTAGTYTIIATNPITGCTKVMTDSEVLTSTLLTPTVRITTSVPGTICNGATVGFGAIPLNGGATPTYKWLVNGTVTSTLSTYTYAPANNDTVSVIMTSSLPCASPDTALTTEIVPVDVPTITATASTRCGGFDTLTVTGGVAYSWAPATGLSCTTCDMIVVNPNSTVVYTITATDGLGCVGKTTIAADGNRITGHISGITSFSSIRVWLMKFNTSDSSLAAIDSTSACLESGTPYYEFDDPAPGSYIVRAEVLGGVPGASGYTPTYGESSSFWQNSNGIVHGNSTDTMHIAMLYGYVYSGPGYISGYVLTGSGAAFGVLSPTDGMLIYLQNSVSGQVLTYNYTNSAGFYSFGGLAYGTYIVYPEFYDYYTTPGYVITLDSTMHDTINNVDFKQLTDYRIITPYLISATSVKTLSAQSNLIVFPNPTSGNLNIKWSDVPTGSADVIITDVVGREVYKSLLDIASESGSAKLNAGALNDGVYIISIQGHGLNYNGKLSIQH